EKGKLPMLVELDDICGDLHTHTNFDIEPSHDLGKNSMQEMVEAAHKRKYTYIGFADHNPALAGHSEKDTSRLIQKRSTEIEHLNKSNREIRGFKLLEVDILPTGELALNDDHLSLLDGAIVSLHSAFSQDGNKMTMLILN